MMKRKKRTLKKKINSSKEVIKDLFKKKCEYKPKAWDDNLCRWGRPAHPCLQEATIQGYCVHHFNMFEAEQEKESKVPLSGRRTAPASPLNKSKLGYDELDTYMIGGCFDDNQ